MSEKKSSFFEKFVPVLIIISFILAFVVGVLWQKVSNLEKGSKTTDTTQEEEPSVTVDISQIKDLFKKDLVKFGDSGKKVLFVEVSDPSCPYCHIASGLNSELNKQSGAQFTLVKDGGSYVAPVPEIKKLVDEGKASYVWLYYNGHGNGELASKALYCAYEKGKFWEAHDLLMTSKGYSLINDTIKNDKTQTGKLADFLKSAVTPSEMKSCLDSGKYDDRLAKDMEIGASLGVTGTPGFFVNENNFAGAYSYSEMESLVTSALK